MSTMKATVTAPASAAPAPAAPAPAQAAAPVRMAKEPITFRLMDESKDEKTMRFMVSPINVSYVNTLRRIILTGVETVGFRSDMISTGDKAGTTTDVLVQHNDTPMTNEMLADRVGLLPIHVPEPLKWEKEKYVFTLHVTGKEDQTTYVTASDFKIKEISSLSLDDAEEEKHERTISTDELFVPHSVTGKTSLIAVLQPSTPPQQIHIIAKASVGNGREHARFSPVSQCSYEYTVDTNEERIDQMFTSWLSISKKVDNIDKTSEKYNTLLREFNTMQVKRCFLMDEKQQPYSYDFTVETVGTLPIKYIVHRACDVGENMCNRYTNVHSDPLDKHITISPANSRMIGFDFLIRGQDHTFGNLIQTWLVENHIEGGAEPRITYAGYSVPHPLRDEIILRIGVLDGKEETARKALSEAARGCGNMFRELRTAWLKATGLASASSAPAQSSLLKSKPRFVGKPQAQAQPPKVTVTKSM